MLHGGPGTAQIGFIQELLAVKFEGEIQEINVPIWFFIGDSDYQVPFVLAEKYFAQLVANQKIKVGFSECGHMIPFEKPVAFCNEIIKIKNAINGK